MNASPGKRLAFSHPPTPRIWSYWCAQCLNRTDTAMVIATKCANCGSSKLATSEKEAEQWNKAMKKGPMG